MPGLVTMENGGSNGARTDHDRDPVSNGVNGGPQAGNADNASGKGKPAMATGGRPDVMMNGGEVGAGDANGQQGQQLEASQKSSQQWSARMNDLPDEIVHITQGFIPLSLLLTRLAQMTHNALQDKVAELAKMPAPAAAVNGNSNHTNPPDDTSNENLRKKAALLNFIQDQHGKWVKALVITEWSRKAPMVSKLIDLKFHIDQQRIVYDNTLDDLVNIKRDLTFARMPSPDLKTALQVLAAGTAPWIPDLQYIEPPPLTAVEQSKWINELNTLLSLRLNLDDYDKIPHQFRDYQIGSGRVTFKVHGEFEVDLTIADEDPTKQFWFIDFRFGFSPSASTIPVSLRTFLEAYVNDALEKDGLIGCFKYLHEFVLTTKIHEAKRQALQLSRGLWTGTLQIEPLNRALAIQYWTTRTPPTGLKSWVMIAVDSRKTESQKDPKASSGIVAKWYRDNKEVKDVDITMDVDDISVEKLLRSVVGHHVEYTLTNIRDRLLTFPRFKNREAGMVLHIDRTDAASSSLTMQVGYTEKVSMMIEPTTGAFAIKPHSKFTVQYEHQLNNGKSPTEDGAACLENIRCSMAEDTIQRQASVAGWQTLKSPLSSEELRSITKLREWSRTVWLQRNGWGPTWFIVVLLGSGGDEWWLVEAYRKDTNPTTTGMNQQTQRALKFHTRLPLNKGQPALSDTFWSNLTLFATGMITQSTELRELHRLRIKSRPNDSMAWSLPQQIRLPSIEIGLSAIFPNMVYRKGEVTSGSSAADRATDGEGAVSAAISKAVAVLSATPKQAWAKDSVMINFRGVQAAPRSADSTSEEQVAAPPRLLCNSEAVVKVLTPAKFEHLRDMLDGDVAYDSQSGFFSLQMQHPVGDPAIGLLKSGLQALDRFVTFMEAMSKAKGSISSESVTLREVAFSYGEEKNKSEDGSSEGAANRWRVTLDLSHEEVDVHLEKGSPHTRIVDFIKKLVNEDGGIGALLSWLPASLPAMKALEVLEREWTEILGKQKGALEITMKTVDWIGLRYTLGQPDDKDAKRLSLEVNMKMRRGESWWHIWRLDRPGGKPSADAAAASPDDEFDQVLKPLWNSKGEGWIGLVTGAAAKPEVGITAMLSTVDAAVRGMIS